MAFDVLITNGTVYDGTGREPYAGSVAISGDTIATTRAPAGSEASTVIDATGLAVSPGFVNMLSHSYSTILQDPRSLGELTQGVTTQVMGEGSSMGPWSPEMVEQMKRSTSIEIAWTRLCEYLAYVEKRGTSQNVSSLIGATTLRMHAIGHDNRPGTPEELDRMRALVREEMQDGALGIGSALIYPPGCFAPTEELVEICTVAAEHRGKYFSHLRSEAEGLLDGLAELIHISREAGLPAENWHLKAAGPANWPKMATAIEMIEDARAEGLKITADVYTYTAGATGLASAIPARFHDGGPERLYERLADPAQRAAMREAIETSTEGWENLYLASGGPEGVLILSVRSDENRRYQGKRLAEVAGAMGVAPTEALLRLVESDRSRVGTAYFIISEDNLRAQLQLPWVSIGSDAGSMAAEGEFLRSHTHPRSYGTFARFLGRYVRDEGLVPLAEAIRRMTSLPCGVLELERRGRLSEGFFADAVVFDPATIGDRATFEDPHQYSVGVRDVLVNGVPALRDGVHTGRFPGRALYGPGKRT